MYDGSGNAIVGNTTSGCFSPTLGSAVCFAYVPSEQSAPGTKFNVLLLGQLRPATVLEDPIVLPHHLRGKTQK